MSVNLSVDNDNKRFNLTERITEFTRHARLNGFKVGIAESLTSQHLSLLCGITDKYFFKASLKSLMCSCEDDWDKFDELFDAFWLSSNMSQKVQATSRPSMKKQQKSEMSNSPGDGQSKRPQQGDMNETGDGESDDIEGSGSKEGASSTAITAKADFQSLTDPDQMRQMELLVERLAKTMKRRLSRRKRASRKGRQIDLRKTVRGSLPYGGTPVRLEFKQTKPKPPRLVIILDVSRSMSMVSFLFLRFARGLVNVFSDVVVFAYHTHLLPITEALKQTDLMRVRNSLAMMSDGWSGGTKIGESLRTLNQKYGTMINSKSHVFIVSDGLDTGDKEVLVEQLSLIKQRSRRLVWLNPLLGQQHYEVRTESMQAVVPLLDLFAPANNLESLRQLEPELARL
ncbi:MAG: VWA domain-containing protein [Kangiellaceae bacterium]|nr:VWA domain-containing protein [Kangiellaceae bacterium]